jgi:RNA polymerase sigma-70 factor (ECF subfamily)
MVQEVPLAIHRKRHTCKAELPVRTWPCAMARQSGIDAFRRRGPRIDAPIMDDADSLVMKTRRDPTEAAEMTRLVGMRGGAVQGARHRALKDSPVLRERQAR